MDDTDRKLGAALADAEREGNDWRAGWIRTAIAARQLAQPGEGSALIDEAEAPPAELTGRKAPHGERVAAPEIWDLRGEPDPSDDPPDWQDDNGRPKRPRYCGGWSVLGEYQDDAGVNRIAAVRIDCGRWCCPKCAPRRARRVRKAIEAAVREHGLTRFLTLTISPKRMPPDVEAHAFLSRSWARFRARVQKETGRSLVYLAVVEHHKSGAPHLHCLIDRYLDQRKISQWWKAATRPARDREGSPIVDIRHVDEHRAARYVVKYLAKEIYGKGASMDGPKFRRVSASRGIRLHPEKRSTGWTLVRSPISWIATKIRTWYGESVLQATVAEIDRRGYLRSLEISAGIDFEVLALLVGDT